MQAYILRRLLLFIPTLLGASILIFVLMRLVPGDIAEILVYQTGSESSAVQKKQIQQIRARAGARPAGRRPVRRLDRRRGARRLRPVLRAAPAGDRHPQGALPALDGAGRAHPAIAVVWAVPLGVVSAVRQNGWLDYLARVVSLSGLSLPLFFTGALILYAARALLPLAAAARVRSFTENPVENLKQLIWPALAQAYYISAPITRLTRSQMLEVIRQDYVRTARAKGLAERAVVYRHALRNSLLPVVTFIGWWGGRLLGGLVIMEIIFVVPGMGSALVQAVSQRDYPTVQAMIFVMALVFLIVNLAVDLLYAWLDPRIRYA